MIRSTAVYGEETTQEIEDTGPLTRKRMETVDDEASEAAMDWIRAREAEGEPWFPWWSGTRRHFRTHVSEELDGISGQDECSDGVVEHDRHVGRFLELLDDLDIADETIVLYSTDNDPHVNTWPDAGMTPFWSEKNTDWEGASRMPATVRWPGQIPEGEITNEIVHHTDWLPTFLAAAGNETVKEDLLDGVTIDGMAGRDYRVHLDGCNILPLLTGETEESPRREIFHFTDDGDLSALRYNDWKIMFLEQKECATLRAWIEPYSELRAPLIFNLRRDPDERACRTSNTCCDWWLDRAYLLVPAQAYVATFEESPPRQEAASVSLRTVMDTLPSTAGAQ